MDISIVWACDSCKEDKRPLVEKNIKEEIPGCIEKYQALPPRLSIRLTCSHPYILNGEAATTDGKIIVFITYLMHQDGDREYRHWTIPVEAKP